LPRETRVGYGGFLDGMGKIVDRRGGLAVVIDVDFQYLIEQATVVGEVIQRQFEDGNLLGLVLVVGQIQASQAGMQFLASVQAAWGRRACAAKVDVVLCDQRVIMLDDGALAPNPSCRSSRDCAHMST